MEKRGQKSQFSFSKAGKYYNTGLTKSLRGYIATKNDELQQAQDEGENIKKDISEYTGIPLWKIKKIYKGDATLNLAEDGFAIYKLAKLMNCSISTLLGVSEEDIEEDVKEKPVQLGLSNETKAILITHNQFESGNKKYLNSFLFLVNYLICKEEDFLMYVSDELGKIHDGIIKAMPNQTFIYPRDFNKIPKRLQNKITKLNTKIKTEPGKLITNYLKDMT